MASEVAPVDPHGPGFPVPPVVFEHFPGDGFEEPLFRQSRRVVATKPGKEGHGALTGLVKAHAAGIADRLPDTVAFLLAVNEETLVARRQDTDAEALQPGIANIVWRLAGLKGLDPALGKAKMGHGFSSCVRLQAGEKAVAITPQTYD